MPETTMTTPDRIAEIRARLAAATPGPWRADEDEIIWSDEGIDIIHVVVNPENADLIAHAPDDLRWCLDEIDRLRAAATAHAPGNATGTHGTEPSPDELELWRAQRERLRELVARGREIHGPPDEDAIEALRRQAQSWTD